jgi:solute carrier family 30 (zinc transporter), member 1
MAWSKATRIKVMLGIDIAFFLLEIIVGLVVHSLALTADAFHMVCRGRGVYSVWRN